VGVPAVVECSQHHLEHPRQVEDNIILQAVLILVAEVVETELYRSGELLVVQAALVS
jgi:hypothetical protein